MGMTRESAADYLAGSLAEWWSATGIDPTDDPASLAEIIDDALLAIGTAYDDLSTAEVTGTTEIRGYRLVLRYTGLLRIQAAYLKADVSLSTPGVSKRYGSVMEQLAKAIEAAKKLADPFISSTSTSNEWGFGVISTDHLEPVVTA